MGITATTDTFQTCKFGQGIGVVIHTQIKKGIILAIMLALPILAGFSQPIGLLIVAFALWEAFKLNRKVNLVITGPHNIGHNPDPDLAHV